MAYQVSECTKQALIQAAGELFAHRDVQAVSVREITARAGVKVNAVSYHFGGKDGLVDAVIESALDHWKLDAFDLCRRDFDSLSLTSAGCKTLLIRLLQLQFQLMFPEKIAAWKSKFLLRILVTDGPGREKIASLIRQEPMNLIGELFRRITGCQDPEIAYAWFLNVIGAAAIYGSNLLVHRIFNPDNENDRRFYRLIRYWGIRNALQGIGLFDPEIDSDYQAFDPNSTPLAAGSDATCP